MSKLGKVLVAMSGGIDSAVTAMMLHEAGYEVIGMVRRSSTLNFERIKHIQERLILASGDLLDHASLIDIIETYRPHEVYNLAAQSFVQTSWSQAIFTGEVTALGVTRLLDAIRLVDPEIRFYQASTSEMFGKVRQVPQNEETPFYPRSPYGVAKTYGHFITVNYRESYNLFACSGILFNHESPRRGKEFVTRKISDAVAKIKMGIQDKLYLGNIDAKRDWGFTGDYVEAMWLMLQQKKAEDFVVGTGETHSVEEFVEIAFDHVKLDYKKYVKIDKNLYRPAEVDHLVGDSSKIRKKLGWKPQVSFKQLVHMMVEADLEFLKKCRPEEII